MTSVVLNHPNYIRVEEYKEIKEENINNVSHFAPMISQFGSVVSKTTYSSMMSDIKENISEIHKLLESFQSTVENINHNIASVDTQYLTEKCNEKSDKKENNNFEKVPEKKRENEKEKQPHLNTVSIHEVDEDVNEKNYHVEVLDVDEATTSKNEENIFGNNIVIEVLMKIFSYFKSLSSLFSFYAKSYVDSSTGNNSGNEPTNGNDVHLNVIMKICAISAFGILLIQCSDKTHAPLMRLFVATLEEYVITLLKSK